MAVRHLDSFDGYGTLANMLTFYGSTSTQTVGGPTAVQVRTGTNSMRISVERLYTDTLATSGSTCVVGFAFFLPTVASPTYFRPILAIREGTTVHWSLAINASRQFEAYRGDGVSLLQTSSFTVSYDTWMYLEVLVAIHDTTGTYEVRVDTVNRLSAVSQDTRNGGTGVWTNVGLSGPFTGASTWAYFDDLYVLDGSGASNNTFLGVQRVDNTLPKTDAAGAGTNSGFTPSTGSDHGALVDEASPNGDTDYNASSTLNSKDTYHVTALPSGGTITAVMIKGFMKKTDAGARSIKYVTRSGGTDYDSASDLNPLTSYSFVKPTADSSHIREVDPATAAAWTAANVNACEIGVKVSV